MRWELFACPISLPMDLNVTTFHLFFLGAFIILFIIILPHLLNQSSSKNQCKKQHLPPRPWCLPIIGNLHQVYGPNLHISLHRLSTLYGPLMLLQLGSIPTLIVSSIDSACEIFTLHDKALSNRPKLHCTWKFSYNGHDVAFAPYGEYWRIARRVSVRELLNPKRVESFQTIREEEVEALMSRISSTSLINMSEVVMKLMNDITCRVAFRWRYGEEQGTLHQLLAMMQELAGGFCILDFFPWPWLERLYKMAGLDERLDRVFTELDRLLEEVIEHHICTKEQHGKEDVQDLMDVLLRLWGTNVFQSRDHLKGILADIFVAGTETSSASVIWTMTELLKNPSKLEKAQQEVRNITPGNKHRVEEGDLPKLQYLKLVIKESLRLHPPVPLLIPRETTETCEVQGYTIPAKTRVIINARAIGRDPNYWVDPDEFIPERFVDESEVQSKGRGFQYIPFGAGRRMCPGIDFAMKAMELTLANLLYRFDWKVRAGELDMEETTGLAVHKKNPLWLAATPATID